MSVAPGNHPNEEFVEIGLEEQHQNRRKELNGKCPGFRLEWSHVSIKKEIIRGDFFKRTRESKQILKDVSGVASAGEIFCLMGPSGSGKTTLLNAISNREKKYQGKVLLNGKKMPSNFNKISAYVMQDDHLFQVLTPRELFEFSANLRLPRETTKEEKKILIEKIIERLGMKKSADTKVGGTLVKGLSGGERKRTAIGYELIINPSLLFLDEPTSGLDSFTAHSLIQTLKSLAKDNHNVICTIHQPSSEIFQLFDKLMLLVQGEVAFFGPVSHSISFFSELGYPCPNYTNPADFYMGLLQVENDEDSQRVRKFIDKSIAENPELQEEIQAPEREEKIPHGKTASWIVQTLELTKRGWRTIVRNPISSTAKLFQTVFMALLVGCVFLRLGFYQVDIANRTGALFFITIIQVMTSLNAILLTFPLERSLLIREQYNGMYKVSSYFCGKIISTLPFDILFPALFSAICYFIINFNPTAAHFFLFMFAVVATGIASSSIGLFLGCILPNAEVAVTLAPLIIIPFVLFGGFYANLTTVPVWLAWLQWISIFKYCYQALAANEFVDETFYCTESEYVNAGGVQVCPITSGNQVLEKLGLTYPHSYWEGVGVLLAFFVGFRVFSLLALEYQTRRALKMSL